MPLVKISLTLLYRRLFYASLVFRRLSDVYIAVIVLSSIGANFTTIFNCHPVNAYWDRSITSARCLDYVTVYLVWSVVCLISDVITLVMPLPLIWTLHLRLEQKLWLSLIFALGGL